MTLTPTQKITARLQAFNDQAANREIIEAHKVKVEAAMRAGPSKELLTEERHLKAIFGFLQDYTTSCSFEPVSFFERDITIEEGRVYGQYGWSRPQIKMPFPVSMYFKEVWQEGYSRWSSKATGKYTLYVGGYGNDARRFQTLKDGSMKYREAAQEIFSRLNDAKRAAQVEAARRANRNAVEAVVAGLTEKFENYNGVTLTATPDAEKPVMVKLDRTRSMSVEAAIELLNVLKKHNIG
jgi:hypothetical protein